MKLKIILGVLLGALSTLAQTNQVFLERLEAGGNVYSNCTVHLFNVDKAIISFKAGGKMVAASDLPLPVQAQLNFNPASAPLTTTNYVYGTNLVTESYSKYRMISNRLYSVLGSSEFRSYKCKILRVYESKMMVSIQNEFPESDYLKRIIVQNYPDFSRAAEDQEISFYARKSGTIKSTDGKMILELWDCGLPWQHQLITTNRVVTRK